MAPDKRDTEPIPHPRALPLVGNLFDVAGDVPILQIADLGKQYVQSSEGKHMRCAKDYQARFSASILGVRDEYSSIAKQ